ncbi:MAG: transcription factor S [Hadesarchaea archaeon B3_Hades]|nr:MAG: transcription factor S [Hadesarchaea archaeon B3_Hades]
MQFCPKCGGLMLPKQIEEGPVLVCNACGYATKEAKLEEYKVVKPAKHEEMVTVIEETKPALPTTRAKCPKCGHGTAYWWLRQTRGADEPTTRFYRCTKCGHTWREYS